jgi:hypothetical protein
MVSSHVNLSAVVLCEDLPQATCHSRSHHNHLKSFGCGCSLLGSFSPMLGRNGARTPSREKEQGLAHKPSYLVRNLSRGASTRGWRWRDITELQPSRLGHCPMPELSSTGSSRLRRSGVQCTTDGKTPQSFSGCIVTLSLTSPVRHPVNSCSRLSEETSC